MLTQHVAYHVAMAHNAGMTQDTKPPARTAAQRLAASRERRRAEGLKKLELWAHPQDHEPIKGYAAKLAAKRAKAARKSAPAKKKAG